MQAVFAVQSAPPHRGPTDPGFRRASKATRAEGKWSASSGRPGAGVAWWLLRSAQRRGVCCRHQCHIVAPPLRRDSHWGVSASSRASDSRPVVIALRSLRPAASATDLVPVSRQVADALHSGQPTDAATSSILLRRRWRLSIIRRRSPYRPLRGRRSACGPRFASGGRCPSLNAPSQAFAAGPLGGLAGPPSGPCVPEGRYGPALARRAVA